jgi:SAM-dependent methyltransferase
VTDFASRNLTDQSYLTGVQYRTDGNLAARQSIYAYQQPRIDLVGSVLELAGLTGTETVIDIGCGNGSYLAGLVRRGHTGPLIGADLSAGMLTAARAVSPAAGFVQASAGRLPLADGVADITLAAHMLYHGPDAMAAARDFRRVTRPGGQVLVVLNGARHLGELRELVVASATASDWWAETITLDAGQELLARVFASVERHDFVSELAVPAVEPVRSYLASMGSAQETGPELAGRIPFGSDGLFRVTTHCGLLICR